MVNKQKTKKINKLKPRTILKKSKLSKKKYSLKRPRKNILKYKAKTNKNTKINYKGGSLEYRENGYDIIENVNLDLDEILNNKKIFKYFINPLFLSRKINKQVEYINKNKDNGMKSLLKRAFNVMNIPLSLLNLIGIHITKPKIKDGRIISLNYWFNYYKEFKMPKFNHITKTARCSILYFHRIPNNDEINLELIVGKKKSRSSKKRLYQKLKNINVINKIPIEEKMVVLIRDDTYIRFKINKQKISIKEPLIVVEFNINCANTSEDVFFNDV